MSSHTTVALSSAVAGSLFLAGCGSESAAGDVDAFCDELRRLDSGETVDMDEDFEAAMVEMEQVRELAPSEIRGDIDVVIDKFGEFEELEANSSGDEAEEFGAAFALAFDPEFIAAADKLEAFGVEECGLEPSSGGDVDGATPADGQLVTEPADVPDPLYDPIFNDEPLDTSELSIDGAQYFLDVNYTDASWRTKLGSWTIIGLGSPDIEVAGLDITESEAPQICSAVLDYVRSVDVDAEGTIAVSTYGQDANGAFGDEQELLRTTVADGC